MINITKNEKIKEEENESSFSVSFCFINELVETIGVDGKTQKNSNAHFVGSYFSTLRLPDTIFIVGFKAWEFMLNLWLGLLKVQSGLICPHKYPRTNLV